MSHFSLNDEGVRAVRSQQLLRSKKLLSKLEYSALYQGSQPDTMLCLTVNPAHYRYLVEPQAEKSIHNPEVIADFNKVGMHSKGLPLYLVEIERLVKPPYLKRDDRHMFAPSITHVRKCLSNNIDPLSAPRPRIHGLDAALTDELIYLAHHVLSIELIDESYKARHLFTNVGFIRESTNTNVLIDPLVDYSTYTALH